MSKVTHEHFDSLGLWPNAPWSAELLAMRATTSVRLTFSALQRATAVAALEAALAEFSSSWEEFLTVAPGGLWGYEIAPPDVASLTELLRSAACKSPMQHQAPR